MDPGLAILTSAGLATLGWLWNGHLHRLSSRRQHTYAIILKQQDDELYGGSIMTLRRVAKTTMDESTFKYLSNEDINKVDYILNYYEFLAASIWCGDIDEKLIRMCDETTIRALRTKLDFYITQSRDDRKQPSMWEHLVDLVTRWDRKQEPASYRLYELATQRPCRQCPRWLTVIDFGIPPRTL